MNNFNKDELPIVEYPHRCSSSDLLTEQIKAKDKRIEELEGENERLRDALEIIKSGYPLGDGSFLDRVQMKEIATEALKSEGGADDCDTCHGLKYIDLFAGDVMPNGNEWRGAGPHRIDCPDCQSEGGGDEEDRLIKKLLNEPQSLRTAKILIKEIVSLKGGADE